MSRRRPRRGRCGKEAAVAVGKATPIIAVIADPQGRLSVFFSDAPQGEPTLDDCQLVCVDCLLKESPEASRGFRDYARSARRSTALADAFVDPPCRTQSRTHITQHSA